MAAISKLLAELAKRAGVDLTDAKYAPLLTIAGDIPDEVDTAIQTNLFNIDAARNNNDLDKHFRGKALTIADKDILAAATKHGLTDDQINQLKTEKNTYAKIGLLSDMVAEKITAALGDGGDKKTLIEEAKKLNKDLADLRATAAQQLKEVQDGAENQILDYAVNSHFRSQSYANSEIPVEANSATARFLFDKTLKEKGAKLVRKDGELHLINASNPDLDYMENNQPVKFTDLSKRILADNKLLKVTEPAAKGGRADNSNQQKRTDTKSVDTSAVASANRQAASEWKAQ